MHRFDVALRAPLTVSALDAALDCGGVTVHYQPVHELATGDVVAVEALARLRLPGDDRLLSPELFLPVAERAGRAHLVDDQVSAIALPQAAAWRALRPGMPFSVAVNVSASRLWDRGLPQRLASTAAACSLPLDALIVELTETAVSDPDAGHDRVLEELGALGVNVTMDDFCTGFSALTHLLRFPVAGIKIDRSFIAALGRDRGRRAVAGLAAMGRELQVHVVAEGVETAEQERFLRRAGVPFVQGFRYSEPLPADQVTEYLLAAPALPCPRRAQG